MANIPPGRVDYDVTGGVATITFGHPDHNAMPLDQLHKLAANITQAGVESAVKVVVVRSEGDRTFCAGAHFGQLATLQTIAEATSFFRGFADLILAVRTCEVPVVMRVQGRAVGGGVGLAAAADYCMATRWGTIKLSELSIGIGPYVIEPAITRKMGTAAFGQLALNPTEWQEASWAGARGLYQEVFDTVDLMDDYLNRYIAGLCQHDRLALANLKALLWENTGHWPELMYDRASRSAELLLMPHTQAVLQRYRQT